MNDEKLKKISNKKIVLGAGALVSMIAIVVIISIFPFVLDPSQVFTTEWWTNELILVILVVYSVICVMFIGQASNSQDARSNIAKAKVKFRLWNDKIDRSRFEQWIEQVLEPRDQESVYKRVLRRVGIKQYDIINLTRSDLKSLVGSPQRINNKWYDEITKEQYHEIILIKNGEYNIDFVDASYYLTDKNIDTEYTRSEKAKREQTKKNAILGTSLFTKILMMVIIGLVFGMFTRDMAVVQDKATSLMKLGSRLMTILSGSFLGFLTGCQQNDISADYIDMKAEMQKECIEDKDFKSKSVEEIAKAKFINKYEKELKNDEIKQIENEKVIFLGGNDEG